MKKIGSLKSWNKQIGNCLSLSHGRKPMLLIASGTLAEYLGIIAQNSSCNSVLDYFANLRWDGVQRVEKLFPYYFNTEDTEYERAVSILTFVAIVRRAKQPGVKYDDVAIIEGPQGSRKSSAVAALCPSRELFSDNVELGISVKRNYRTNQWQAHY